MEHYDWNDGWLFTPVFDPAIVRPECPELTLEPVRLPHTVKALPYNYCNENDYQKLSGYRREFFAPKEWEGRTVLLTFGAVAHDATVFCNGRRTVRSMPCMKVSAAIISGRPGRCVSIQ